MAIEVLQMQIPADLKFVLTETENRHHDIVEALGAPQIGDSDVDMIDTDDVCHTWRLSTPVGG